MELFACGSPEPIARNVFLSGMHARIAAVVVSVSLFFWICTNRRGWLPCVLAAFFAIHPAWTNSARTGDCGNEKVALSWAMTATVYLGFLWQLACWYWETERLQRHLTRVASCPESIHFRSD